MKTRKQIMYSATNEGLIALCDVVVCDRCGGESFTVFVVPPNHNHIMCTQCEKSFCDGTCGQDWTSPSAVLAE